MTERVTPGQIGQLAATMGLDPQAVLAVASQEGLGGGIGDQGTSFGPFQLHYGGAYPSSAPQGADASQAWAWSPPGIQYALRQIQGVAGGQKGGQAIDSIVQRFERPANPGAEVAGADRAYGAPVPAASPLATAAQPVTMQPPQNAFNRGAFAQGLLTALGNNGGLNAQGLLSAILGART